MDVWNSHVRLLLSLVNTPIHARFIMKILINGKELFLWQIASLQVASIGGEG